MTRTHLVSSTVLVFAALAFDAGTIWAQDVQWRHDYAAARKEAIATGRPLLLDFGTEACVWCRKLDATTFRDPKVVKLLNERFVPVKLDGNKEQRLTAALQIDGFPTLVVATPGGKVVGRHSGYADVPQFLALAGKAPAPSPPAAQPMGTGNKPQPDAGASSVKAQIDAALAALYPEIAAAIDR